MQNYEHTTDFNWKLTYSHQLNRIHLTFYSMWYFFFCIFLFGLLVYFLPNSKCIIAYICMLVNYIWIKSWIVEWYFVSYVFVFFFNFGNRNGERHCIKFEKNNKKNIMFFYITNNNLWYFKTYNYFCLTLSSEVTGKNFIHIKM